MAFVNKLVSKYLEEGRDGEGRGGGEDFLIKNVFFFFGGGGKHCFLLMYGFCSSNALYSARLLFRMFVFILTPFDTSDCYYVGLNLSLVLLIKVFFIYKACNASK